MFPAHRSLLQHQNELSTQKVLISFSERGIQANLSGCCVQSARLPLLAGSPVVDAAASKEALSDDPPCWPHPALAPGLIP